MPKGYRLEVPAGARYGRLVVVREAEKGNGGERRFLCRCDCGVQVTAFAGSLRSGHTRSCGCWRADLLRQRSTVHGHAVRTADGKLPRLYGIWKAMRRRCENPGASNFDRYGGRGIAICDEWADFAVFRDWATASGYRDDLSIERVDNDGNYEPGNCGWVPLGRQARNKRNSRVIAYRGESRTLAEWGEVLGTARSTLGMRLRAGWPVERAFTAPVGGRPVVDIWAIAAASVPGPAPSAPPSLRGS